jgi:hypothetical protein
LERWVAADLPFGYVDRATNIFKLAWIAAMHQMAAEGLIEEIRPRRPRSLRVFRRAFLPVVEI